MKKIARKKYKIIDVSPLDSYYIIRNTFIGKILYCTSFTKQEDGWVGCYFQSLNYKRKGCFYKVKIKEVK